MSSLKTLFIFLCCLFTLSLFAQKGSLYGYITTSKGEYIKYASVSLKDTRYGTISNDSGYYKIENIDAGRYTVLVSYAGDVNLSAQVLIVSDQNVRLDLMLKDFSRTIEEIKITGVKSVIASKSDYVARMPLSSLENSQVYTGITNTLITQQKIYNLDDVVRNAPGITKSSEGWPSSIMYGSTSYTSRGFSTQVKALNGLACNITMPTDVQNISKIEVIKGPSATLFGSIISSYGGLINRVTKKPYEEFGVAVDLSAGSFNFERIGIDANLPVNKDKSFLSRLNVALNNQGTFMDNGGYTKNLLIAPAFTYLLSDKVKIDLSSEIYSNRSAGINSGIMFSLLPSSVKQYAGQILTSLGYPSETVTAITNQMPNTIKEGFGTDNVTKFGLDRFRSFSDKNMVSTANSLNVNASVQYKISNQWTSVTSALFASGDDDGYESRFILLPNVVEALLTSLPTGNLNFGTPGADYLGRTSRKFESSVSTHQVQQNFIGDFEVGSLRNRMVVGLDYYYHSSNSIWRNFMGNLFGIPYEGFFDVVKIKDTALNYYAFEKNALDQKFETDQIPPYTYGTKNNVYSAYINDVLNITDNILFNAGIRFDRFINKGSYDGRINQWVEGYSQSAFSPKFGLIYQPVHNKVSLFANYQTGFSNVNGVDKQNKPFRPEKSYQWEAGVKYAFFDGNFTGTLSYYDITVNDKVRTDPNDVFFSIQDGTQKSRGFEAEVLGNPFPNFNIMFGYAYNHSVMTNAEEAVNGLRPLYSGPYNQGNIWMHYHFSRNNFLDGFSIGAGGNYVGPTYAMNQHPDGSFIVPSYTLVNAKLSYDKNNYSIAVRVNNLLNEDIWTGSWSINPQMPRQLIGSLAIKF